MKTKLTDKLRLILLEGPKIFGSYAPDEALGFYEEQMTLAEIKLASDFLLWVVTTATPHYGHGTIDTRWAEWQGERTIDDARTTQWHSDHGVTP